MGQTVELVRNASRALGMQKQQAQDAPLLGHDVTTPAALLQEAWELWGDGRNLISASQRVALMLSELKKAGSSDGLNPTVGTAGLLASFVSRFAGTQELKDAVGVSEEGDALGRFGLSGGLAKTLEVVSGYLQRCEEIGLIESGDAAAFLDRASIPCSVSTTEPLFLVPAVDQWLSESLSEQEAAFPLSSLATEVQSRFVLCTGATSVVKAVKEEIEWVTAQMYPDATIAVFAVDAQGMYEALAPYLAEEGMRAACQAKVQFLDTALGGSLQAVLRMMQGDPDWKQLATDFAYSPLSGMKAWEAQALNRCLRENGLMELAEGTERLQELSPTFPLFQQLANDRSLKSMEALKDALDDMNLIPSSMQMQEAAAFTALASLVEDVEACGCSETVFDLLGECSFMLSRETSEDRTARPFVEFLSMDALDCLPGLSVDSVIFSDMTKEAFHLPQAKSATDALAERIGLQDKRDRRKEWRAAFASAVGASRGWVTCIASMRDMTGKEQYPSFLYDEWVEAASQGDTFEGDPHGLFKVPASAREAYRVLDEMDVVGGFGQAFSKPDGAEEFAVPVRGCLTTLSLADFMATNGATPPLPLLSASQLELYHQCPYRWFISRKVGVGSMDEVLDGLHMGTFAHEVFKRTFNSVAEEGIRAVTADTVEHIKTKAAAEFDSFLAEQTSERPGERCVVATTQDGLQMQRMRENILDSIDLMQQMPNGFEVQANEFKLTVEEGIEYAGAIINGSVDRVDASNAGAFVVLDYKGSAADYAAGVGEDGWSGLPAKVQALIYAQSLARTTAFAGLACVGAMYLGYRAAEARKFSAGSFDGVRYDMSTLVSNKGSNVAMDFQEFLDQVEAELALCVQRMLRGDIAPDPLPNACTYCEMTFCPQRTVM